MRSYTVSRRHSRFLYLLVAVSLLLGLAGPVQVLAAPAPGPDLAPQAGSVTLDSTVGSTPTVDSTPTTGTANNTNSITFSHTTGSGDNRLLMVGVSWSSTSVTVTGIKFNSVALTLKGTQYYTSQARRVAIYYLVAPTASTTADVVVSFSGAVYGVAGAVSFAGVDQCTPLGTQLGATGNTATATVSPITVAGDLVFDTVAAGTALTVNGSQAQQWMAGDGTSIYGGASTKPATGTPTAMSWTLTSGYWATIAVGIKPVNPAPKTATASSGSTITFCQTTGTGTDRLLLVGVSLNANTTATSISSITFTPIGGSAISLSPVIWEQNPWLYRYAGIYSLVIPPSVSSGQGGNVLVTLSAAISSGAIATGAANFAGVDTTTPLGPAKGGDGVSGATSLTLTGLVGDELVFDNLFLGGTSTSATAGTGQTQVPGWNAFLSNARGIASTEQAVGSSVTTDWSLGATYIWSDAAVPIIPACTGSRYHLTVGNDGNGTVTLNPPGDSYCAGRIVTLTPAPSSGYLFNSWSGTNGSDVVNDSGVYRIVMNGDKSITANFATPSCQDVSLNVDDDTYMNSITGSTTTNYGNAVTLKVDGGTAGTNQQGALLRWNVSSIPSNASITSASITFNVTDPSTVAYPMYDMAKPWVEGTGAAGSGATWATYNGSTAWGTNGAALITGAIDRGNTNLWSPSTTSFDTAGARTVALNADGLNAVRRWVAGGSNNGVTIQQYSGSTNTLYFDSAEGITPPTLNVNYCLGTPPTYTLTADNDGNGTVNLSPSGGVYSSGTTVMLTPNPAPGYQFSLWSGANAGDIIDTGGVYTIVMNASKTVQANFTQATYTLTAGNDGNGSVTLNPSGGTYASGTTVTLTPAPNDHYIFSSWSGDNAGDIYIDAGVYKIAMNGNETVQANFIPAYKLTVEANPSAGGTTSPTVGDHWYAVNTVVPVTASAATGYTFANWSNSCSGTDPLTGCSVTLDADKTVTANFAINTYALNLTFGGGGGGRVTSAPVGLDCTGSCSHNFDYSTTPVVLTAVAAPGSQFTGWSGESCSGTGTCSVTMTDIRNVTATFNTIPTHNLTVVDPVGSGTTDPAIGIHIYAEGTVVPIAATAASGYVFDHWTGDVANVNAASTTVTMAADKTLTAVFTASRFGYIGDVGPSVYVDASGTSMAITVGSAGVAVGNTIIVGVASRGVSGYTTPIVADSKGNIYTSALCSLAYSHGREYLFYAPVTTALVSGDQIIVTSSPAVTNRVMVASVFSGLVATNPLDQTHISADCSSTTTAPQSNGATSGATATTSQADELVIGLIATEDYGGTTPADAGSGTWLNSFMAGQTVKSQNTNSYRWRISLGRYLASSTGLFTAAQTYTNTPYWAAGVATFKAVPACYALTLGHTGNGSDPTAIPTKSSGCAEGEYVYGASISLSEATPDTGWEIAGWTGTTNDSSTASTNSLIMPASEHMAKVNYIDATPPVLIITGATNNGNLMDGNLDDGYVLPTTNLPAVDHLIQFAAGTHANETLEDTYFGLYLTGSTVSATDLKAYYAARGMPAAFLTYLQGAADGTNPFVYIKGSSVTLVDAAKHAILSMDVAMTVPDDYPLGTYTVQGVIRDVAGNATPVMLKLIVAGNRPPVVSITLSQLSWQPVLGATYNVYQSTTKPYCEPGDAEHVYPVLVPSYPVPADTSHNYYFFVRAVNGPMQSDNSNRVGRFTFTLVPGQ
jgi:hypothetical protein